MSNLTDQATECADRAKHVQYGRWLIDDTECFVLSREDGFYRASMLINGFTCWIDGQTADSTLTACAEELVRWRACHAMIEARNHSL